MVLAESLLKERDAVNALAQYRLAILTADQEQYVYDNPDQLAGVIQANRKAKANADSGDAQTA